MFSRSMALTALCLFAISPVQADDKKPVTTEAKVQDSSAKADTEALFSQGRDALFRGKYTEAIKKLKAAVDGDKDGTNTSYRLHLARAYRYAKQPEQSEQLLAEILTKSADHVEAGQLLAEIYYSQERWEDIARTLEPLLKYRHDYPTYHLLAEATYNLDKYDKSRTYYLEAIKLNPGSGPDHYQVGNIYLARNQFARAAQSYEAALRFGLDSVVLHYKLASAYFNLRNYFGRVGVATVKTGKVGTISGNWYLIESVPGSKDVFRAAPVRSAIFHIAKAIEGGLKDRADTRMLLANIYLNARRYDQAYKMYKALKDSVPEEDRALYAYYSAQAALGVGRYEEYLEQLQLAIKLAPDAYGSALVDAFLQVADKHNQAGDLDNYIKHLVLAVDESPQTTSLHLRLATAFEEARKYTDAVEQWRMVLDLEPDHPKRTQLLNLIKKHG